MNKTVYLGHILFVAEDNEMIRDEALSPGGLARCPPPLLSEEPAVPTELRTTPKVLALKAISPGIITNEPHSSVFPMDRLPLAAPS